MTGLLSKLSAAGGSPGAPKPGRRGGARWFGLQDKLLVSNMVLLVATLACCGLAFVMFSTQQARELRRHEAQHLVIAASVAVAAPLAEGDHEALASAARQLLGKLDARSLMFYDAHGVPLTAWKRGPDGPVEIDVAQMPTLGSPSAGEVVAAPDGSGIMLMAPVAGPGSWSDALPVGYVSLTASDAPQAAHVESAVRLVTGGGLSVVALVLPVIFLLVHRAFAPIRRLAIAARNVASGRFETVDIVRGDALGVLAEVFNDMVVRLGEQKGRADEAHARLLEANLHLEHKIAERTSAIEAASQRLASEIAEKEDFLRAISHDLNAPLRNIDGMVSMVLRKHADGLPEEVINRLERVKKNVEHETSLISELLELSRIKTRREQPEPVNLEEMMWELRGIFENDLREHEIDLVIETRLPTLTAERARIRQVFQNLIDNAIKYMGEGSDRRISIGAKQGLSETEFWVRDSGQGIAPEDIEKIFYIFRRGRNQQGVVGKGVGLASVKSILENYNGRIWVESELGQGSRFRFTINARFVESEQRKADAEPKARPHRPLEAGPVQANGPGGTASPAAA
jgi:signal transduction histidine kinase